MSLISYYPTMCFFGRTDNFKLIEGYNRYNHPQPHWHLNTMKPVIKSFTDLTEEEADSEMGSFWHLPGLQSLI